MELAGLEPADLSYFRKNPGEQVMSVPRATVTLDGSAQPGRLLLQQRNDESDAGRASKRTTVPTGKNDQQVPEPLPRVIAQSIPAGCDVTRPLPVPEGRTAITLVPPTEEGSRHQDDDNSEEDDGSAEHDPPEAGDVARRVALGVERRLLVATTTQREDSEHHGGQPARLARQHAAMSPRSDHAGDNLRCALPVVA
jgi:hypothetical protein